MSTNISSEESILAPCEKYEVLDEPWRRIGNPPYVTGIGYHCDSDLDVRSLNFLLVILVKFIKRRAGTGSKMQPDRCWRTEMILLLGKLVGPAE